MLPKSLHKCVRKLSPESAYSCAFLCCVFGACILPYVFYNRNQSIKDTGRNTRHNTDPKSATPQYTALRTFLAQLLAPILAHFGGAYFGHFVGHRVCALLRRAPPATRSEDLLRQPFPTTAHAIRTSSRASQVTSYDALI